MTGVTLDQAVAALREIAPPSLAEEWDNVGLLVAPTRPRRVRRLFLAVDLTDSVVDEALAGQADLIVAYHPPIFAPLRRLTPSEPKERVVLRLAEARVALYSPHTAADAAAGGVNDWLADGLGDGLRHALHRPRTDEPPAAGAAGAPAIIGQGRGVVLATPATLAVLVKRVKGHLGLRGVRVARAEAHAAGEPITRIALCAGAGAEVILGADAELLWTGEMRHHDVLAAVAVGRSVILCDHTNTERGYLSARLAGQLRERLSGVEVTVSAVDADPLELA